MRCSKPRLVPWKEAGVHTVIRVFMPYSLGVAEQMVENWICLARVACQSWYHCRAGGRTPSCPQPLNQLAMLHALRGRETGCQARHAPYNCMTSFRLY